MSRADKVYWWSLLIASILLAVSGVMARAGDAWYAELLLNVGLLSAGYAFGVLTRRQR